MLFLWIFLILLLIGALIWVNMNEEEEPERPARQRDKENRPGPRIVRVYRGEEHVTLEGSRGVPGRAGCQDRRCWHCRALNRSVGPVFRCANCGRENSPKQQKFHYIN